MVRWTSQTKTVELPKERVQVNYIYTYPSGLTEIQEVVSESLTDFGKWGNKYLTVWLCHNDNEWKEAHTKLLSSVPKDELKLVEPLITGSGARMAYATKEMQDLIEKAGRILEPSLILRKDERAFKNPNLIIGKDLLRAEKRVKKASIKHEYDHKFQIDYGYFIPIFEAFNEIIYRYYPISNTHYDILRSLTETCDNISANEVGIDFGFRDDVFIASKYNLDYFKSFDQEKIRPKPKNWLLPILSFSSFPIPFKHKNEEVYASKMRRILDDYFKRIKVLDAVVLRKDFEETLDKVRNPPKKSDIKIVYDEVIQKIETFL